MIVFENVEKRYGDSRAAAVRGLTLEAPTAAITVLVGPSGCGKTTTLRMVNRMVDPTAGRVLLDGRDVRERPAAELRRSIGYVIQQAGLFEHRTVLDNVATVPRLLGTRRRAARTRARELLERVGLDPDLGGRYPAQLSGGQQQRVGVARALAADPPVLLMDEPFSAVDAVVRRDLQDELLRLQAELDKTVLLVTHDIDEAIRVGDRIAVLRDGGVLAQAATPVELLTSPADAFVESFLGTDRGVRRLGFLPASLLRLRTGPVTAPDTPRDTVRATAAREPWLLVTDAEQRPRGWLRGERAADGLPPDDGGRAGAAPDRGATPGTTSGATSGQPDGLRGLEPIGHVFTPATDSVRAALDATVLSPSGMAAAVDSRGRVLGVVGRAELDTAIREAAADWAPDGDAAGAPHRADGNAAGTTTVARPAAGPDAGADRRAGPAADGRAGPGGAGHTPGPGGTP